MKSCTFVGAMKIIHVDMDQFFAAVEQRDQPELRGKPIAVGHDAERGVVSTASYEARRFGVHSAQSIQVAKRLCPQLIIVEPHFQRYKEVSAQLHEIFHDYTDLIEPISLDEAFLDVTENKRGIELGVDIAREIKQRIRETTGLTASAGVSYCKFLAKIASDWRKPDGLTVIHPDRALDFIAQLRVEKIWGVGPKTAEKMHHMGIFTGLDLRNMSLSRLTQEFGKVGQIFYDFSRGIDNRPVISEWERKSVSCEQTFESDISENAAVTIHLYHMVLELVRRIEKNDFEGRTLTLKVKFARKREQTEASFQSAEREQTRQNAKFGDFQQITRSITVDHVLRTKDQILPLAKQLMQQVEFHSHPIRLLGLGVANQKGAAVPEQQPWVELELEFEPWPDDLV
jgi:DNA polymerase-4